MCQADHQHQTTCYFRWRLAACLGIAWFVLAGLPAGDGWSAEAESSESRLPIPAVKDREKADRSVQEVFAAEIARAKTPAEQISIVEKMQGVAQDEQDPNQRYALLTRARTLAVASGDIRVAMRVVEKLVDSYRIDVSRAELVTLQGLAKSVTSRGQHAQLAEAADSAATRSAARDAPETALELNAIALESARRTGSPELLKRLVLSEKELQANLHEFAQTKPYRAKLEESPDDPEANLALGKYHCFFRRDWRSGLALLAKGGDAGLKAAATRDLQNPASSTDQAKLADLWWALSEGEEGRGQEALRSRAAHWYHQALPELSGLARARAEKRLGSGETATAPSAEVRRPAGKPGVSSHAAQRALLDYVTQEIKAGKLVKSAEHGFTLGKEAFSVLPEGGGLLVGLDVSISGFNKITGVRPQFLTSKGVVAGPVIGEVSIKGAHLISKKGYAIGAITLKGGIGIDGLGVTYMPIEEDGLNSQQSNDGPLLGNATEGVKLGGDGAALVGIYGHRDKNSVSALGIIQVERRK